MFRIRKVYELQRQKFHQGKLVNNISASMTRSTDFYLVQSILIMATTNFIRLSKRTVVSGQVLNQGSFTGDDDGTLGTRFPSFIISEK